MNTYDHTHKICENVFISCEHPSYVCQMNIKKYEANINSIMTGRETRKRYRPRVQSEWNSEDILKLIKALEERPTMWDKEMEDYRLPKVSAWQEVAEIIGNYSPEECKAKWNNLRVTFNTNLVKYHNTKSSKGSHERKKISWQYFKPMLFLTAADARQSSESKSSMHLVSFTSPRTLFEKKTRRQNRPKVQSDWNSEDILTLIKALEERPIMWDKGMEDYRLPKVSAWQEVAEIIGNYSPEECKAKWNNLRVTFNTNLAKYCNTKSAKGSNERNKISWQYFNPMLFLEAVNVRQSAESKSSLQLESAVTKHSEQESSAAVSTSQCTIHRRGKRCSTEQPSASPSPSPTASNSNQFKELAALALNIRSNRATTDEYSAFGEYIAAELRSIHGPRAAYVKRKLNRTFVDLMDEVALMDKISCAPAAPPRQ